MFPDFVMSFLNEMNAIGHVWLVGGACRDHFLGIEPHDFDFVTTTPELFAEFPQTGKDFPVYQVRHQGHVFEIAAARTEKKTGNAHTDFTCELTSSIHEDLQRRDFTINAVAYRPSDGFIFSDTDEDYLEDIKWNILRHVSPAFSEDPLRVMRLARFAAKLNSTVSFDTVELCRSINDQMQFLTMERVQVEFYKAMQSPYPHRFFEVLRACHCLDYWFPEIAAMDGCEHGDGHHPEGDVFVHTMLVIKRAAELKLDLTGVLAALVHDIGKPPAKLVNGEGKARFYGHGKAEHVDAAMAAFVTRFNISEKVANAMYFAAYKHQDAHNAPKLKPGTLTEMLKAAKRSKLGVDGFINVCKADSQGRGGDYPNMPYDPGVFMAEAADVIAAVNVKELANITPETVANAYNSAVATWKKNK